VKEWPVTAKAEGLYWSSQVRTITDNGEVRPSEREWHEDPTRSGGELLRTSLVKYTPTTDSSTDGVVACDDGAFATALVQAGSRNDKLECAPAFAVDPATVSALERRGDLLAVNEKLAGSNLGEPTQRSSGECARGCLADPRCSGFVHGSGTCWLKTGNLLQTPPSGSERSYLVDSSSVARGHVSSLLVRGSGGAGVTRKNAPVLVAYRGSNEAACAARCVETALCAAVAWDASTSQCAQHSEFGSPAQAAGIRSAIRVEPSLASAVLAGPTANPAAKPYNLTLGARYLEPAAKTTLTLSCPQWTPPMTQELTASNDGKATGHLRQLPPGGVCTLSFAGNPDSFRVYLDAPVLTKPATITDRPVTLQASGLQPGDTVSFRVTCGSSVNTEKKTADGNGKASRSVSVAPGTTCSATVATSGGVKSNVVTISVPSATTTVTPGQAKPIPMTPITH
jgi:hypothetical protein